jgi:hypothetical protein
MRLAFEIAVDNIELCRVLLSENGNAGFPDRIIEAARNQLQSVHEDSGKVLPPSNTIDVPVT